MAKRKKKAKSPELKAAFFDVRGTLWDGQACARHAMEIILPKFMSDLPEDDLLDDAGDKDDEDDEDDED